MKQKVIRNVFDSWEEAIIWSCLEGVMGDVYTNDVEDAAMAILGDFAFYAGNPSEELIKFKPEKCKQDFIIMIPQNEEWGNLIEKCYGDKAKKVSRYAIKKELAVFDIEKLEQVILNIPAGYELKMIEESEYHMCQNNGWSRDLVSQYKDYRRKGLAYACGAKLILECLKRDLYPSWDAQNKWSVALAEKLGYHFSHEYVAYEVTEY